ncbi:TPA: hypothetical protein JD320_001940 [Citrobacter koseri]|uniref:hypothetical protein n=1 Tax=Citrobacter koseri TaxID=545 RepID=UPI001A287849|nr:hypothetical protein [Citrobacter koseri]HAV2023251.1 hypothetical protein [Citrobacter koseri]HDQ2604683.1 hypothetical protein [Citrobacter koseri]
MSPVALLIAPASKWQQTVPIRQVLIQVINAGRQLLVCIHRYFLKNVDMNVLSAFSDQVRQPQWSEIVKTVSGSLLPATVRPAPFYTALSCSLSQMEAAYV